jgi:hypothetical protein
MSVRNRPASFLVPTFGGPAGQKEGSMSNTVWYEIRTLDGRRLSRTHGLGHDGKWRWVTNTVMGETGCDYEDIDIEEAEDGDFVTVHKKRYARVIDSPTA